jgi:hypothetical protein
MDEKIDVFEFLIYFTHLGGNFRTQELFEVVKS